MPLSTWEWDPAYVPPVKLGIHAVQIAVSFVIWCLAIAVFRGEDAKILGDNGWAFGVCFLSIPAWVYLVMTPRFDRTRHLANANVMLLVDVLFVVIWISAFAAQASYTRRGFCGKVCNLSNAIIGLGVLETLLWVGSTLVSGFTWNYAKFNNSLPGYDNRKIRDGENIDPDKAAFSMAPHDDYERVNMDDHDHDRHDQHDQHDQDSHVGGYGAGPYSADDIDPHANHSYSDNSYGGLGSMPPGNPAMFDADTEYNSGPVTGGGMPQPYGRPAAYDEPAHFPAGNYDRVER